jgi:hypothetical protein
LLGGFRESGGPGAAAAEDVHGCGDVFEVVAVAVLFGERHGGAERLAARDDGDLVYGVGVVEEGLDDGVAGFVAATNEESV